MKKLELMEADHSSEGQFRRSCEMISQPSCSSAKFRSHFVRLRNSPEYICCLNPNSLLVIHQLDDSLVVKQEYRGKQPTRLGMNQNGAVRDGATKLIQSFRGYLYCNLCMPYWIRDQEGRLVRIENPQDTELDICVTIMDPPPEDQSSQQGQGGNPNTYLSMRDRMHPPRMSAPSCILPPLEQLVIRPHIVPLLPTFHGMESENPYSHIKEFEEDKAKIWLNSLRPRSIRNWVDLQAEFLKKYFPTHRTNGLKRQISNFSAKENEKFHECWERYMEAINACPHHGFDTWLLVSYFYDGMSSSMKQILETMCGGDFMSKNPDEAMDFLSYVAEVSRGWDEPNSREKGKFPLNKPKIQKSECTC
ncbi:hypothetical protein AAG906_035248 [Vitis piasezkii]